MKKKLFGILMGILSLVLVSGFLTACGGASFVGAWDDDAGETSIVFYDNGTGVQSGYAYEIPFTYTVDGDTAVITAVDYDLSVECRLEDGMLVMGSSTLVKRDAPSYTPANAPSGGKESELTGSWVHESGYYMFTFDGKGDFTYLNNVESSGGNGTYTFDGSKLVVTLSVDGEVKDFTGSVSGGAITISVWGESGSYAAGDESQLKYPQT